MQTDDQIRRGIGDALRRARGARSVHSAGASGVGYRTIDRLESARKDRVDFSTVYLLALHYDVGLGDLLRSAVSGGMLERWPAGAPSLPETDAYVRRAVRAHRVSRIRGTPWLARISGVHQAWLSRLEAGDVRIDLVRLFRIADALKRGPADLLPDLFQRRPDDHDEPDEGEHHVDPEQPTAPQD